MNLSIFNVLIIAISLCLADRTMGLTVELNGHKYIGNSQTVEGDDIEWMRWDLTRGFSPSEALIAFSEKEWRLASNSEVSELFYDFGLGDFDADAATSQLKIQGASLFSPIYERSKLFFSLFGLSVQSSLTPIPADIDAQGHLLHASYTEGVSFATAILQEGAYAEVGIEWGIMNYGWQHIDFSPETSRVSLGAINDAELFRGVALVRQKRIPEPNSLLLFCLSLAGLYVVRSQKNKLKFELAR